MISRFLKKFLPKRVETCRISKGTTVDISRIIEIVDEPAELKNYRVAYSEALCQDCGKWECTCG